MLAFHRRYMVGHEFTEEQIAKYWDRVEKPENPDDCWRWTGATSYQKAATLGLGGGRTIRVIRMAYLLEHGSIPDGKVIVQTCGHHWCVNPDQIGRAACRERVGMSGGDDVWSIGHQCVTY